MGTAASVRSEGSWAIIAKKAPTEILRVTACITSFSTLTVVVEICGSGKQAEPRALWNSQTSRFDTVALLRQLGASLSPKSPEDRGVLSLSPRSEWQRGEYFDRPLSSARYFMVALRHAVPQVSRHHEVYPVVKLSVKETAGNNLAHGTHAAVFQETLHDTRSPALAVQALLARVHQMAYYGQLPKRNTTVEVSTSFAISALIPTRWTEFIAATSLIATHFIIMAAVLAIFLGHTTHSLIGKPLAGRLPYRLGGDLPILEQADGMKDEDVESWAKSESVDFAPSNVILRQRNDGRVALSTEGPPGPRKFERAEGTFTRWVPRVGCS